MTAAKRSLSTSIISVNKSSSSDETKTYKDGEHRCSAPFTSLHFDSPCPSSFVLQNSLTPSLPFIFSVSVFPQQPSDCPSCFNSYFSFFRFSPFRKPLPSQWSETAPTPTPVGRTSPRFQSALTLGRSWRLRQRRKRLCCGWLWGQQAAWVSPVFMN